MLHHGLTLQFLHNYMEIIIQHIDKIINVYGSTFCVDTDYPFCLVFYFGNHEPIPRCFPIHRIIPNFFVFSDH